MGESRVESPAEMPSDGSHIRSARMPYHKPEIHTWIGRTEMGHIEVPYTGIVRIETAHNAGCYS